MFDTLKAHPPFFTMIENRTNPTYYTLTREQIQAIATRAAELAVKQALDGWTPPSRFVSGSRLEQVPEDTGKPELTEQERQILESLFRT